MQALFVITTNYVQIILYLLRKCGMDYMTTKEAALMYLFGFDTVVYAQL